MTLAPIVLFVYNRPEHTRKTVEALQANRLAIESELFIYSDAPKNDAAALGVSQVREFINGISGFKKIEIIERDRNWGLADSIMDGVTRIVNEFGKVIVLEDDVVVSPVFLEFMNDALSLYESDSKVMHISGYFPPVKNQLPETFFYNQASCWGWATWSRAWKHLIREVDVLLEKIATLDNPHEYFKMSLSQLRANQEGRIKTWATRWQMSILLNDGLCLHPRQSYARNIGNDGSGENSGETDIFDKIEMNTSRLSSIKIEKFTEFLPADELADKFLKSIKPSFIKRLIYRMKYYGKS